MPTPQTDSQVGKKLKVSFIVTTYNLAPDMLRECLESILALSLSQQEREIILVDDGSEKSPLDSLGNLLGDLLYVRQKNQGLSIARNTGLQMASGNYIQFVDGDDMLISSVYEHCLDIVRSAQADMVIFDFTHSPKASGKATHEEKPMQGTELMRHHNIRGTACGYLFRRAILGDLRFTPGTYHEDEEFTPHLLLRAETVYKTEAKAYFYRKRANSITTDKEKTETRLSDMQEIIVRLNRQADRMPSEDRQAMQRRVAQLTMDYIYKIIVDTRNRDYLNEKLNELRAHGLYPLPNRNYTRKYNWFQRLANSEKGLRMLMFVLPYTKRER